ncbi:hypothetical protein FE257_000017 [Aspergillus nanangensis]|uniref:Zn(2)-C6 fungal-type domain-containing protein n=1 Tax=Aspergillus nanangensis TaxID=2582783 RepID=A0AAD4CYK7_ASPNN|nr:hypothetical protein FE257_000017 [Aspergillus nanangensis]
MSGRRYRSTIACQNCRQRKVRCTVTVTGIPCIGCSQDGSECILQRRRGLRNSDQSLLFVGRPRGSPIPDGDSRLVQSSPVTPNMPAHLAMQSPEARLSEIPQPTNTGRINDTQSLPGSNRDREWELSGATIANASLQPQGQRPFYTGDHTGFTPVLDVMAPEDAVPRHILLPSSIPVSLSRQDREFLQYKGCLDLPPNQICVVLLQKYFHHVHPLIPVVEPAEILKFQHSSHAKDCNLLLLWAVFFLAVNFIPKDTVIAAGFPGRMEMKASFFGRAKCMYDNGGETDKIVKLQAAVLLGFWYSEEDDYTQPWYWTGIAVNLCFIMGLHRNPDSTRSNPSITGRRRSLWRRLWWSCFFRDCWLGLTLGRPLRICLNDCTTPMLSLADIVSDLNDIPQEIRDTYIPRDFVQLSEHWIILLRLSQFLGEILTLNYQPHVPRPNIQQIEALESRLLQLRLPQKEDRDQCPLLAFSFYHLQLHYQSALITFYRPCLTKQPEGLPDSVIESWQTRVHNKINSAAFQTNAILDSLTREKLLTFTCPMTPPLLVPAMHIHLLNCKSDDPLSRQLGLNKVEFCMLVLKQMQEAYTVASVYRGIFAEAIRRLFPTHGNDAMQVNSGMSELPLQLAHGAHDFSMDSLPSEGLIDELLQESSFFNVWESLAMMQ